MRRSIYIIALSFLFLISTWGQANVYADFGNQSSLVVFKTELRAGEKFVFTLEPDETPDRPQWPVVFIDWLGNGDREMINLTTEQTFEVVIPTSQEVAIAGENGLWTVKSVEQQITQAKTSDASILRNLYLSKNLLGKPGNIGSDFPSNGDLRELHLDLNYYEAINVQNNPVLEVLNLNSNKISALDLTRLDRLREVSANKNLLTEITMPASASAFAKLDLRVNRLNIATLPTKPTVMQPQDYLYTLQERYRLPKDSYQIGEEIDLSAQLKAKGIAGTEQTTIYKWYVENDATADVYTELIEGTDYTLNDGKTRFLHNITGALFVGMTTSAFPDLESFERTPNLLATAFDKHGGEQILIQPAGQFAYEWPADLSIPSDVSVNDMTDGRTKKVYRTNNMTLALNYWYGALSNDWANPENWTGKYVPRTLLADVSNDLTLIEDVEFATSSNNRGAAAIRHLFVDQGKERIVRNVINHSELGKGVVIPSGSSLRVMGQLDIVDESNKARRMLVRSIPGSPNGTLYFDNPILTNGGEIVATVEFYSKGFNGNMHKQLAAWQYFGSPVRDIAKGDALPKTAVVRKYDQAAGLSVLGENFDEKWLPVAESDALRPFHGYEISQPTPATYLFRGILNVESPVGMTVAAKTNVFYSDFNAFANSYTAPYDITKMVFNGDLEQTVYLFNTGNRENWKPLNANLSAGETPGQYISIPKFAAGSVLSLAKEIPSLQGFMVRTSASGGSIEMPYSGIVRDIATNQLRSGEIRQNTSVGSLTMDVASDAGADRVWLLTKEGTTPAFDNGWDGRKLFAAHIPQLYVEGEIPYQVAAAADIMHTQLGFIPSESSNYTIYFHLENMDGRYESLALLDKVNGQIVAIEDGGAYTFSGAKTDPRVRFEIVPRDHQAMQAADALRIWGVEGNRIRVENNTAQTAAIRVYDLSGRLLRIESLPAGQRQDYTMTHEAQYVIKADNGQISVAEKVNLVR